MKNFFGALFGSSKKEETTDDKQKNGSKNFDVFKYDGIRALKMGRIPYAIRCFTEALDIQDDFETMNYLASAYVMAHESEQALEVLNRMVELEPDHIETRLLRVNTLFMLDKDGEVIPDCLHILELDSSNHPAYLLMAKAKRTTNDALGAIADLTKAIAQQDDFIEAYLLRSEILLEIDQGKEALMDVEKVISLTRDEEAAYLLRGRIYESVRSFEAAKFDYQQALDLNPFNEEAYLLFGKVLIAQEKYEDAITFFDEAIEMNPQFAKAYAERGRAKNLKGDKEGAFNDLKMAVELDPEGEEAQKMNGQHSNFDNLYKGGIF